MSADTARALAGGDVQPARAVERLGAHTALPSAATAMSPSRPIGRTRPPSRRARQWRPNTSRRACAWPSDGQGRRRSCAHRAGLRARVDACIVCAQARIDRPVDKRRASHPLPQAAFKLASFLRQPRLAQAVENGLELGQIGRVVAPRRPGGAGAGDGEGRVERETGLDGGMRLVKSTKLREGGGQLKICVPDNFDWPRSPVETTRPLAPNCRGGSSPCPRYSSRCKPSYRAD